MKKSLLFMLFLSVLVCFPIEQVYAIDPPAIFVELSGKISHVGEGFIKTGMVVAGFGLLSFAVAAMFNKISWKTFAYIAISVAVLSATAGIMEYMGNGNYGTEKLTFGTGAASISSGGTNVPVSKGGYK